MTSKSSTTVAISSRHRIHSASDAWRKLPTPFTLTPLDHLVAPFIPIAVVFLYDSVPTSDEAVIPVNRFRTALSLLLDSYPHLTGRLEPDDAEGDGTRTLDLFELGAELVEAICTERLDSFPFTSPGRILTLPDAGNALLPPYDVQKITEDPVFTVQHTRFACGAVALGIRVLHTLCDADGYFGLVQRLAQVYSSATFIEQPIFRIKMEDQSPTSKVEESDLSGLHSPSFLEYRPLPLSPPNPPPEQIADPPQTPRTIGRFLRFSSAELKAIKSEASNPSPSASWISTFDALCAHLYRHIHRARTRHLPTSEISRLDFLTPVNLRARLPATVLGPSYFPNALLTTNTTFASSLLSSSPLWEVAAAIHSLTHSPGVSVPSEILNTLSWIESRPDKRKIESTFQYGTGSLMVSQWSKMDMYKGTAFGDRKPVLVSPPFTEVSLLDGLLYFLPTEEQGDIADKGAIDVSIALHESTWEALDRDEEFRRFR